MFILDTDKPKPWKDEIEYHGTTGTLYTESHLRWDQITNGVYGFL